jgi:hypothetical protein
MKISLYICSFKPPTQSITPKLIANGIIHFNFNKNVGQPFPYIAHALLTLTEQLKGLYDNSLLGKAYKAYRWTSDTEWNKTRRSEINAKFIDMLETNVFRVTQGKIYIALPENKLNELMNLVRSIGSQHEQQFQIGKNKYTGSSYAITRKKQIQHVILIY